MWPPFLLTAMAVAGLAVLWRNWLEDYPQVKNRLKQTRLLGKALTCGSCFTYWLSLFSVLSIDVLPSFQPPWLIQWPQPVEDLLSLLFKWMALAITAISLRFSYVLIQEAVSFMVHHLNHKH